MSEPQGKNIDLPMYVCMSACIDASFHVLTVYIANKTRHMASGDLSLSLGPDAFFA